MGVRGAVCRRHRWCDTQDMIYLPLRRRALAAGALTLKRQAGGKVQQQSAATATTVSDLV
jgi:hypothetical protein